MSESTTTERPLAVGQIWKPKTGKSRRIINIPGLPGIHFVHLGYRVRHVDSSAMFREWIRQSEAQCQEQPHD